MDTIDDHHCPMCYGTGRIRVHDRSALAELDLSCPNCSGTFHVFTGNTRMSGDIRGTGRDVARVVESMVGSVAGGDARIVIRDSVVGSLDASVVQNINLIAGASQFLIDRGEPEVAAALTQLTQAVASDDTLSPSTRAVLIRQLEEVARQAALPKDERASSAIIQSVINGLSSGLGIAGNLASVWSAWGSHITRFFGGA